MSDTCGFGSNAGPLVFYLNIYKKTAGIYFIYMIYLSNVYVVRSFLVVFTYI